ncbi:MAG TPA: hypothetical protein PLZ93_10605 [Nocardioides sp.]|uniref:hypothetical protein n=1 Tax=uncultured Nocardioides sp. TaxID=198441 RepID=UPI000EBFAB7B|nr:hypothetical protein [uncultured Nocardioides sp.]HCB03756.1 hypothetical protein [Nocardioides sp.]HRD63157.1 hypothetical protein [Nocardioides sp.]HRI96056.1 hypothetical protein [Nocardioides sp.]HRK45671.1 hypothetical protein [Nocardioides sp.]
MAEEYCDLCDLPLSTCIHGMPKPPPPPPPTPRTPRARTVSSPRTSTVRTTSAPTRAPSKVTDQSVFRPHIVRILKQEGSLETEDMLLELEMAMEDDLRERDRQPTPTGEVRWHQSARKERKAMIDAGLMAGGKPGVWELTDAGRSIAYEKPS